MGHGHVKRKNELKKQMLKPLQQYCQKLEKENEALKTDPETTIGQLIPQFREIMTQNKKLCTLAATLLKFQNGRVKLPKTELESFDGQSISIKWELPEGVDTVEAADELVFSY